jgi:hypothetical protein
MNGMAKNRFQTYMQNNPGSITGLANQMGITKGAVWQWTVKEVPMDRVFTVSRLTGLSLGDIRPDRFDENGEHIENARVRRIIAKAVHQQRVAS